LRTELFFGGFGRDPGRFRDDAACRIAVRCPERIGRRARGGPGLAGDVEDALRALLPMLREHSDRTFLRPPAENLRRLVRRHDRRARGHGHEQSETPLRTGL